jgi:uncharacterized protein with HEPN domain
MNEKLLEYLYDIKLAVDEIDSFFEGKKKNFANYANDLLLKRAIERNLEIFGVSLSIIFPALKGS